MSNQISNISGRHAIVTGGTSGIGEVVAETLSKAGCSVSVGSRRAKETRDPGWLSAPLDIRDPDSIARFLEKAKATSGPVDILVNAAGISGQQPVIGHDDGVWRDTIDINLTGAFQITRAVLPDMRAKGWGRIVLIGSTAASAGHPGYAAYCASKAGLLGLARCIALEHASDGITCNLVSPSWVDTPMMRRSLARKAERDGSALDEEMAAVAALNPTGRLVQPEQLAALTVHLCSDAAGTTTMQDIVVSGGAGW